MIKHCLQLTVLARKPFNVCSKVVTLETQTSMIRFFFHEVAPLLVNLCDVLGLWLRTRINKTWNASVMYWDLRAFITLASTYIGDVDLDTKPATTVVHPWCWRFICDVAKAKGCRGILTSLPIEQRKFNRAGLTWRPNLSTVPAVAFCKQTPSYMYYRTYSYSARVVFW